MIEVKVQREDGTVEEERFESMESMLYWAFEFKEVPLIIHLTDIDEPTPAAVLKAMNDLRARLGKLN